MGTSDNSVGLRSPIDRGYKLVVLSNSRRRGFSDDEVERKVNGTHLGQRVQELPARSSLTKDLYFIRIRRDSDLCNR